MQVIWDNNEQTVLRLVFEPHWTRDQLRSSLDTIWQTLEQANHAINIIIDQTETPISASDFVNHAKLIGGLVEHANAGALAIVGADRETRALCSTASYRNTLCRNLNFVDTLDEAYDVFAQLDFVAGLNNMMDGWVN